MIYLDHNATSPLRPNVQAKMQDAFKHSQANPNSMHLPGQQARALIESSRKKLAEVLSVDVSEIVFTASATEANFLAVMGLWLTRKAPNRKRILTSPIEHSSVHENLLLLKEQFGAEIVELPVLSGGAVDLNAVSSFLTNPDEWAFACLMGSQNETGVIQPWMELAKICGEKKIPFHSDVVQLFGRTSLSLDVPGLSTASLGFHKIGGPKGCGALIVKKGVSLVSVIRGGSQEKKRRAGTENIIAIAGIGALCEEVPQLIEKFQKHVKLIRDRFETAMTHKVPQIQVVGKATQRLPNTSYVLCPGVKSDALLTHLDMKSVCASSGAACSSGMTIPSRTLLRMGYGESESVSAVRFSLGPENTEEEVLAAAEILSSGFLKLAA